MRINPESFAAFGVYHLSKLRQGNHESGTTRIGSVELDVTTQAACNTTCHSKTDARSVNIFVKLDELLEDVLGLLLRNANAGILNKEPN